MKTKETIQPDYRSIINKSFFNDMANAHIETWKERYWRKTKPQITVDLRINHDISIEVERAEELLKRKLNDKEHANLFNNFNKAVIRNYYQ